jgi:hypothetical protein
MILISEITEPVFFFPLHIHWGRLHHFYLPRVREGFFFHLDLTVMIRFILKL